MISYGVAGLLGAVVGGLMAMTGPWWVVAITSMAVGVGVGAFSDLINGRK